MPTRRFLYRQTPGAWAYHVYYTVEEESPDGPRVTVLHVGHAFRQPLTAKEGREIRRESE